MKIGLPEVLKYLRRDCKLTQKQLAKETGLSLSAIVSYENGLRQPNSRAMAILERYFGVSGEYLRGDLDNENFHDKADQTSNELSRVKILMDSYYDAFRYASQKQQQLSAEIYGEFLQFQTDVVLADGSTIEFSSKQFRDLLFTFRQLNAKGQEELFKRVIELTQIQVYKNS